MALTDLTDPDAVRKALVEHDQLGADAFRSKYGFGPARDCFLVHDGKQYDSKAIVGVAHGFQRPDLGPLGAADFNGGEPTIQKLRTLGFDVVGKTEASKRAVWVVRGGREGQGEPEALESGIAAIGWKEVPDLRQFDSPEAMASALREHDPGRAETKIAAQKGQLYAFAYGLNVGDLVLMPLKTHSGHVAVGRVESDYYYRPGAPEDTRHVRDVTWLARDVARDRLAPILRWMDRPPTVSRIPGDRAADAIDEMLLDGGSLELSAPSLGEVLQGVMDELASDETDTNRLRQLIGSDGPAAVSAVISEGWVARGRTGIGTDAHVPWIGVYPADSEASAQSGYYVVYLFAADGSRVYLSLNQGTENVRGGTKTIAKRTLDLRSAARVPDDLARQIDLRSAAGRPKKYEAGSAAAIQYASGLVPGGAQLQADLTTFLGFIDTAAAANLAFDPEIEPLHLVLKWSTDIEPRTVAIHKAKVDEAGSAWWGRYGSGSNPVSSARMEQLQEQLDKGIETLVFLYGGNTAVRTRLEQITGDPEDVDDNQLPGYLDKEQCNLFLRLTSFSDLDPGSLIQRLVLASNPDPAKTAGALSNRTNPLFVYELREAQQAPSGDRGPRLDGDWLSRKTLWPQAQLDELLQALEDRGQVILAGPPGTGKTWVADHVARFLTDDEPLRVRTVQFHPSYGYEEFVEGLRPVVEDGALTFKRVDGVIKQMATEIEGSGSPHVLIIDELNRANIPRVFGELMYLLEYRDKAIDLQYSRDFELPTNLKIIATMNTADRSIRSIDVALRRRFEIFECPADPNVLRRFYESGAATSTVPALVAGFEALNGELTAQIDRHHTVGQSFFMRSQYRAEDLRRAWERQIAPLIEDYFFDQPDVADAFNLATFWPDL